MIVQALLRRIPRRASRREAPDVIVAIGRMNQAGTRGSSPSFQPPLLLYFGVTSALIPGYVRPWHAGLEQKEPPSLP